MLTRTQILYFPRPMTMTMKSFRRFTHPFTTGQAILRLIIFFHTQSISEFTTIYSTHLFHQQWHPLPKTATSNAP